MPPALKVFIVAFAVIDDLGAIVLIAAVYTTGLSFGWLAAALGIWLLLIALNRLLRIMPLWPYLVGGVALWFCVLQSGIHASVAGVMLAFAIPFTSRDKASPSPSHRLMHWLHKPVAFLILPLFALANTGVILDAESLPRVTDANVMGIALGLLVGKPLGVLALCGIAVTLGLGALPDGVRWKHIVGAGLVGGIGFTMSIFITNLAFAGDANHINDSKVAVLAASPARRNVGLHLATRNSFPPSKVVTATLFVSARMGRTATVECEVPGPVSNCRRSNQGAESRRSASRASRAAE